MSERPSIQPTSSLWRDRDFRSLWFGQSVSSIGGRITGEALPLAAVISLHATPLTVGWLQLVAAIPSILLGMWTGAWIDRKSRRGFLITTDLLRFILLLLIPALALVGQFHMWLLFAMYPILNLLTLMFTSAYESYVPALVGLSRVVDANAKLSITRSFAEIVGPGIAGLLVQALTAPIAILIDALSYLVSAFSMLRIKHQETIVDRAESSRPLWQDIREGIHYIAERRILVALTLTAAISSLFGGIVFTMDVLYAIRTLHLHAALFGFTVTFGGIGAIFGAWLCRRLARRIGYGQALFLAAILNGIFGWLIPIAHGPVWMAAIFLISAQLFGDFCGVIYDILESSLRQGVTDDHVLGRVNTTINLVSAGLSPIGALAGGYIATAFSLRVAMAVGVGGITVAAVPLLIGGVHKLKRSLSDMAASGLGIDA